MVVLALSAALNLYGLANEGYANAYYAAAIRSMLQSWPNFFVSFDPGGFVTVDKPPLGFMLQTISAKIFGYHGWSILLPQAQAGVAAVGLLSIWCGAPGERWRGSSPRSPWRSARSASSRAATTPSIACWR